MRLNSSLDLSLFCYLPCILLIYIFNKLEIEVKFEKEASTFTSNEQVVLCVHKISTKNSFQKKLPAELPQKLVIFKNSKNLQKIYRNTQVYNLISVPQITQYPLGDAIILSKTTRAMVARRRREAMLKLEQIKQC